MDNEIRVAAYGNLKTKLLAGALTAVIFGFWSFWFLRTVGIPFYPTHDKVASVRDSLLIVSGIIPIMAALAFMAIRRARLLATRGIIVEGCIVELGLPIRHGGYRVTVAYRVGGAKYSKKVYMSRDAFVEMKIGVLCDPRNPRRAEILGMASQRNDQQRSNLGMK